MRSLIISFISILLILGIWLGFMVYCENTLTLLTEELSSQIEVHVAGEDWPAAREAFQDFSDKWHKQKKIYSFFLEQSAMLDTDFAIARAQALIQAEDQAAALGELAAIREQMRFLYLNEKITLENLL